MNDYWPKLALGCQRRPNNSQKKGEAVTFEETLAVLYNSGCVGVLIDQNIFQPSPAKGVTINSYIPTIRGNYIGPNNVNCIITDNSGDLNDLGGGAFQTITWTQI
jgi:hypothetical protein